jgi:periplasmic protein TonB
MIDVPLERVDLRPWVASAAVILALHVSAGLLLLSWQDPLTGDQGTEPIVVDLAPFTGPSADTRQDLAPGPEQQQAAPVPEQQPKEPDQKIEKKIEPPPPVPNADVTLPNEVPKEPDKPKEQVMPPAPVTTAPTPPRPSAAQLSSWHRKIAIQLERHKNYPAPAQARRETGVATVAFTIDREGKVVASRITRSSGFASLDDETIATVQRAAPLPPPPANLPGQTFDFTVPIQFNIR